MKGYTHWCPAGCGKSLVAEKFGLFKCTRCDGYAIRKGVTNAAGYKVISNDEAEAMVTRSIKVNRALLLKRKNI